MLLSRVTGFRIMVIMIGFIAMVLPAQGEVKKPQPADKVATVNGAPVEKGEFDEGGGWPVVAHNYTHTH